ncbi:Lecithin:cholesterol acyltransferase family protein [Tritrichomonas foetus]|uniref:Lecithin:cholesterol acyltransferase family protein n=1 Tax=Tritrichomonas foetus TaxID=1144522 RepID=A0A1J4JJE8_9EUKA|nr:Lecithin:cholesterol acyltransferase family protein [Tritrichomonas foetus]|eukprot:OHS98729.1 Lecithin:cholesterol acyltransferase family protein [Tritrichomonas foetus]
MFFIFALLANSLKPVIVLPPLYGTNLWITYNQTDANWYCPDSVNDELLWVNPKWAVPPMHNCLFQFLQVFWDHQTNSFTNRDNATISTHNFGGEESVRYVVPGIFGYNFIESFASLIDEFKKQGYTIGKDLFAAPYDWRIAPVGLHKFWPMLHDLVEHASKLNDNQKVTMFGFSCGGHSLQQFLGEYCQNETEWKSKYIDRAVFLAPSIGGVGQSFPALWNKIFPVIPILKGKELADMIESMPVVHAHLPNHNVFGDMAIVRSSDDVDYTAAQLRDLLVQHKKVTGNNINILDECQKLAQKPIAPPGVPAFIVYNSGIFTEAIAHFKKGWNKPPKMIPIDGDGTVPSKGIEYACENWPTDEFPVRCVNLYRDHPEFEHQPLASNPFVHSLIYNLSTTDTWWQEKGRKLMKAPYVVVKNDTYIIRNDIRPGKVLYDSENQK